MATTRSLVFSSNVVFAKNLRFTTTRVASVSRFVNELEAAKLDKMSYFSHLRFSIWLMK